MPIGFNLFSFDFFEAFRRNQYEANDLVHASEPPAPRAADDDQDERDRQRVADQAFWGLGYFPVL